MKICRPSVGTRLYISVLSVFVVFAVAFIIFQHARERVNKEVAKSFRDNILSKGGTEDPAVLYKRFRGQEPTIDALLIRNGIKK